MLALLPIFLQYLPELASVAKSVPTVAEYIGKMVHAFKQSGELTAAQEKELDDAIAAHDTQEWWQPGN
jgi:hypothetical protein